MILIMMNIMNYMKLSHRYKFYKIFYSIFYKIFIYKVLLGFEPRTQIQSLEIHHKTNYILAARSFDLRTLGLWALCASSAPSCLNW